MSKQMRQLEETVKYDDMLRMLDEAYEQEQLEKEIRVYEILLLSMHMMSTSTYFHVIK